MIDVSTNASRDKKTYRKVVDHIKGLITDKRLAIGDKLPTERELSSELELSRNSAREALRALEIIGLVESKQGSGNYLAGNFSTSIADSCATALLVGEIDFVEVVKLRRALELEAFGQAFANKDEARLEEVERAVRALEENYGVARTDPKKAIELDSLFHNVVIRSAGNRLVILLTKGLSTVLSMQMANEIDKYTDDELNILRRAHRAIYEALRDRKYRKGVEEIGAHYDVIEARAADSIRKSDPNWRPSPRSRRRR